MRTGIRIGIDWGEARIGVARSDPAGSLALPLTTVRGSRSSFEELAALVTEYEAMEVVVGLPLALDGTESIAAAKVRRHAERLAALLPVPVRLVDERLSTAAASRGLHGVGLDTRRQRGVIDQAAAAQILDSALELERSTGRPPGELVLPGPSDEAG